MAGASARPEISLWGAFLLSFPQLTLGGMMKTICVLMLVLLGLGGIAHAGQQAMVPCPALDDGCVITCAELEILTSAYDPTAAPLLVEFLDANGGILASATFSALSANQMRANLDTRVIAAEVDSIRLFSEHDGVRNIGWAMLKVLCDPCACACWTTVYKGCLCDWRPTPELLFIEPLPEPEPEPLPKLIRVTPPAPEVITVPGRG